MVTKKVSVWSIVLYVLAGLLFVYALWAAIAFVQYLKSLIDQGQLSTLQGQAYNIIASLMTSSFQYVIYGVLFIVIGKLLAARQTLYVKRTVIETPVLETPSLEQQMGQEMEQEIGIAWSPAPAEETPAEAVTPQEPDQPSEDKPEDTPAE